MTSTLSQKEKGALITIVERLRTDYYEFIESLTSRTLDHLSELERLKATGISPKCLDLNRRLLQQIRLYMWLRLNVVIPYVYATTDTGISTSGQQPEEDIHLFSIWCPHSVIKSIFEKLKTELGAYTPAGENATLLHRVILNDMEVIYRNVSDLFIDEESSLLPAVASRKKEYAC